MLCVLAWWTLISFTIFLGSCSASGLLHEKILPRLPLNTPLEHLYTYPASSFMMTGLVKWYTAICPVFHLLHLVTTAQLLQPCWIHYLRLLSSILDWTHSPNLHFHLSTPVHIELRHDTKIILRSEWAPSWSV